VYRQYLMLLARLQIGRCLQGKVDPSDMVQETCFHAHRDFADFRGTTEAEFVQWLRRIMAFQVAKLVRRYETRRRDVHLERQLQDEIDQSSRAVGHVLVAPDTSPTQKAARHEHEVLLADAIEQLPDDYREVMILHHLEGLEMPTVAHRMGRSLDSVRKLWARAMVKLREALKEYTDEA
jgi:RNA polymerase sigma-70 factor (ECF subfamily)